MYNTRTSRENSYTRKRPTSVCVFISDIAKRAMTTAPRRRAVSRGPPQRGAALQEEAVNPFPKPGHAEVNSVRLLIIIIIFLPPRPPVISYTRCCYYYYIIPAPTSRVIPYPVDYLSPSTKCVRAYTVSFSFSLFPLYIYVYTYTYTVAVPRKENTYPETLTRNSYWLCDVSLPSPHTAARDIFVIFSFVRSTRLSFRRSACNVFAGLSIGWGVDVVEKLKFLRFLYSTRLDLKKFGGTRSWVHTYFLFYVTWNENNISIRLPRRSCSRVKDGESQ